VKEHTLWREHAYGFVAYEGDMPVSTATAIINEECLFLFMVATAPDARRKGYGEAVMRHAFRTAHEATGIRRSVLHATELGYPRISTSWIPPNCEVHGMHVGVLRSERGLQRSFHVALPD
jgi:GNAT superfamily N-acetyltransferase